LRADDRRKDIFIATVAHELRQPVAAMLPALAVMRQRVSEQPGTQARDVIERQVTHLRRMIDDMMDIARVVQGKLNLRRERTDCRDVIHDALYSTSMLCEEHHNTLSVSLPDEAIWLEAEEIFV
jgi:signal transduction histidine kinase